MNAVIQAVRSLESFREDMVALDCQADLDPESLCTSLIELFLGFGQNIESKDDSTTEQLLHIKHAVGKFVANFQGDSQQV